MFDVSFPHHGAILNHNHGKETGKGLTIEVKGTGGFDNDIRVNGSVATYDGSGFSVSVNLTQKLNTIIVEQ